MVSDSDLIGRLQEFLSTSDLNTTTTATVRRKLEEDFGIDLSERKAFIREQIDLYLETQQPKDEDIDVEQLEDDQIASSKGENQEEEVEEEEEEEEDEDDANGNGSSSKRGSKRKNTEVKKRGGGGFTKVCSLSPQLQKFTGVPELARTEVVKQLWSYIRENNLQDPSNRRTILCDETLRDLFEVDSIDMFQMNKSLAKHIWPLNSDGPVISTQKAKPKKLEKEEDTDEPKRKEKKQKGGGGGGGTSGFLAPIPLSDALVKFLGTGENALPRSAVVKRIWDYIKQNNLQDPSDKRNIICDEKLKELFDVDTFNGFTVSKLLTTHFIKPESRFVRPDHLQRR